MLLLPLTGLVLSATVGAIPASAARTDLRPLADSVPILTVDALTHMTTFWAGFVKEPDSVTDAASKANQVTTFWAGFVKEPDSVTKANQENITVSVGWLTMQLKVVDMNALAAKFPSVVADLQRAGLTAEQWEAYRVALFSVLMTQQAGYASEVPPTSGLGNNLAFVSAHQKEIGALKATGMWFPVANEIGRELLAPLRLSVRPRTMATGIRTTTAGLQELDAQGDSLLRGAYVYVPPQCVGTKRMPLVVFLHGAGMDGESMINWRNVRALADSNGFIIVAPSSSARDETWLLQTPDGRKIDVAVRYVLQHYAIDPTRIALAGSSDGGRWALWVGLMNEDVFSRVLGFSPSVGTLKENLFLQLPRTGKSPMFIEHGIADFDAHAVVEWLRHEGYAVTYATDSGGHQMTEERASAGFRWLAASWKGGGLPAGKPAGARQSLGQQHRPVEVHRQELTAVGINLRLSNGTN